MKILDLQIVVAGLALAASGCGYSTSGLADDICDCEGCTDTELDELTDDLADAEKKADDEGCSDQFAELLDCTGDQFACRESRIDVDGCDSESDSLKNCMGGTAILLGGSPCDALAEECAECLGSDAGGSCDIIREGDPEACESLLGAYENNPACTN